jgi:hypothetical protein
LGDVTTGAARDIDTVQELTNILVAGEDGLMDRGSGLRDRLDVDTSDDDLILNISRTKDRASLEHGDLADLALSKEVTDLNTISLLGLLVLVHDSQVDREVIVDETHLVGVSLGDSDDHIPDVGDNSADASQLLLVSPPDLNLQAALSNLADIQLQVLEALGELAERTSHTDEAGNNVDRHYTHMHVPSINPIGFLSSDTNKEIDIIIIDTKGHTLNTLHVSCRFLGHFSNLFPFFHVFLSSHTSLRDNNDLVGHDSLHTGCCYKSNRKQTTTQVRTWFQNQSSLNSPITGSFHVRRSFPNNVYMIPVVYYTIETK